MLEILYICVTGVLVVFAFLLTLYLLIKGIELFAADKEVKKPAKKKTKKVPKATTGPSITVSPELEEEKVAAIMIALEDMSLIDENKKIIIKAR